jgi:hypothetical protein
MEEGSEMKRFMNIFYMFSIITITNSTVVADVFVNSPELNPDITWETQYPYQRNIMMDFSINPVGATGPIPGAEYDGYDDPYLWDSDLVTIETIEGNLAFDAGVGGIGISGEGSGTITFHLGNWEDPLPVKHVYEEYVFTSTGGVIGQDFLISGTITDSWNMLESLGEGSYRISLWREFQPNPPWEEIVFTLECDGDNSDNYIYLDSLHIATECVPVPGAFLLGILGLGVAGYKLRKFDRSFC